MKVAVTGKGGVGKTTVAASLARALRDLGHEVVAVDADPDANLAGTLGYRGPDITPLVKLKALIQERVGGGDGWGGFLRMNPRVDDIPQEFGIVVDGIRVLVMGTIDRGRRGCACPENVLLREVLNHLILDAQQDVVVDMEAGVEHLGRGTAEGRRPDAGGGRAGLGQPADRGARGRAGGDLGIKRIGAVANRVASEADLAFVRTHLSTPPLLGVLPADPELEREAREGSYDEGPTLPPRDGCALPS